MLVIILLATCPGTQANQPSVDIQVVAVGKSGNGKSETLATLYGPGGSEVFASNGGFFAQTQSGSSNTTEFKGHSFHLHDTVGFQDTSMLMGQQEHHEQLIHFLRDLPPVEVFLWCIKYDRVGQSEAEVFQEFVNMAGKDVIKHTLIVITNVGNRTKSEITHAMEGKVKNSYLEKLIFPHGMMQWFPDWLSDWRGEGSMPFAVMGDLSPERRATDRVMLLSEVLRISRRNQQRGFDIAEFKENAQKLQSTITELAALDVEFSKTALYYLQGFQRGMMGQQEFDENIRRVKEWDRKKKARWTSQKVGASCVVLMGWIAYALLQSVFSGYFRRAIALTQDAHDQGSLMVNVKDRVHRLQKLSVCTLSLWAIVLLFTVTDDLNLISVLGDLAKGIIIPFTRGTTVGEAADLLCTVVGLTSVAVLGHTVHAHMNMQKVQDRVAAIKTQFSWIEDWWFNTLNETEKTLVRRHFPDVCERLPLWSLLYLAVKQPDPWNKYQHELRESRVYISCRHKGDPGHMLYWILKFTADFCQAHDLTDGDICDFDGEVFAESYPTIREKYRTSVRKFFDHYYYKAKKKNFAESWDNIWQNYTAATPENDQGERLALQDAPVGRSESAGTVITQH